MPPQGGGQLRRPPSAPVNSDRISGGIGLELNADQIPVSVPGTAAGTAWRGACPSLEPCRLHGSDSLDIQWHRRARAGSNHTVGIRDRAERSGLRPGKSRRNGTSAEQTLRRLGGEPGGGSPAPASRTRSAPYSLNLSITSCGRHGPGSGEFWAAARCQRRRPESSRLAARPAAPRRSRPRA